MDAAGRVMAQGTSRTPPFKDSPSCEHIHLLAEYVRELPITPDKLL